MQYETHKLWNILRYTFGITPIVAGLDKFTNLLVHWDSYISPAIQSILPVSSSSFMGGVGIIEIFTGIFVLEYTKIGSYIVMAWLVSIALVLMSGGYFDIAVRDLVMAACAYVLAQLTALEEQKV
ncbi:MAG: hypothetical protein HYV29_13085 [Ignavibacteriales bacterium]|nr:hypothetical protein [Ignavibacteriales bacterium]